MLSYTVKRTFLELRDYHNFIHNGGLGPANKIMQLLTAHFPEGEDGEDDPLILIERKDQVETVLKESVTHLNVLCYHPLNELLDFASFADRISPSILKIQALGRGYIARKNLPEVCYNLL